MKRTGPFVLLTFFLFSLLFFYSCGEKGLPGFNDEKGSEIIVIASTFPLYDFAREIGGDNASVIMFIPPGVSPHAYEPTPRDIEEMTVADVFIYNGAGMEPWVTDIINGIDNPGLTVVNASLGADIMEARDLTDEKDVHEGEVHNKKDPHYWLDFGNAIIQVENILEAMVIKDPENEARYRERGDALKDRLDLLDDLYREALADCNRKDLISSGHFAFGYMARRYGLNHIALYSASHNTEPSPGELAEMIDFIEDRGVEYILREEMVSPRMAETIREETGAEILLINPAGNVSKEDFDAGITFIEIMEVNLEKLKTALGCD